MPLYYLFGEERSVVEYLYVGVDKVRVCQRPYSFRHLVLGVQLRSLAVGLNKGVYSAVNHLALVVYPHRNDWGVSRNTTDVDARWCAEVSKAVGNEMALVYLHSAAHMRSVAVHNISALVNAHVGETA